MFDWVFTTGNHHYSLAGIGLNFHSEEFNSRREAECAMYDYIDKKGLRIVEVYDDRHNKTYIAENGIRFFINRV